MLFGIIAPTKPTPAPPPPPPPPPQSVKDEPQAKPEQTAPSKPPKEAEQSAPPPPTAPSANAGATAARAALGVAPERPEPAPVAAEPAFRPAPVEDQDTLARALAERARESAVQASFVERIAPTDTPAAESADAPAKDAVEVAAARYAAEKPNFAPASPPGLSVSV